MRLSLRPHPDTASAAVTRIDVDVLRPRADELVLRYAVSGRIGDVILPAVTKPARMDELWKHTCFEAFIGPTDGADYTEFNFAPSTAWAAYRFDAYREGMAAAAVSPPRLETLAETGRYELQAVMNWPGERSWRLALSAVIEATNGEKSYWALAHPAGKPDFHHADSFAYELPVAEQT